jgi:hypothetical protein
MAPAGPVPGFRPTPGSVEWNLINTKPGQLSTQQRPSGSPTRTGWVPRCVDWWMPAVDANTATARERRAGDAALPIAQISGGQLHGGRQQECIGVARIERRAGVLFGAVVQSGRRTVVQGAVASSQPRARKRSRVITSRPHATTVGGPRARSTVACRYASLRPMGNGRLRKPHWLRQPQKHMFLRGPGVAGPCVPANGHTGSDARRLSVSLQLH